VTIRIRQRILMELRLAPISFKRAMPPIGQRLFIANSVIRQKWHEISPDLDASVNLSSSSSKDAGGAWFQTGTHRSVVTMGDRECLKSIDLYEFWRSPRCHSVDKC